MTCSKKSNKKEQAEQRKSIKSLTSDIDIRYKKLTEREPIDMELDNDYFDDTFRDSEKDHSSIATKVLTTSRGLIQYIIK
ncbi:16484_t:CDS:2 [Funneliformis mosseae]|uniref:16484_t:CDS:1 n=1 Tax=Funneliformis mosseae TaxID=27381 RepID=A0A9N9G6L4_FUNMO|nr:16484_t:CDS:2 [Funneliformis mosseae]